MGCPMNIKVGETWRTRGGHLAVVVYKMTGVLQQPFVVIHNDDDAQCAETHSADGKFRAGESDWDLVSRVDPKPLADQLDELFQQIAAAGHGVPGSIRLVEEVRALEGGAK